MKVLLDTDIGGDIDDAVCLAYLLAEPQCELLGITTVTGNPQARAAIASSLCRHAGQDVPIVPGVARPLLVEQREPDVPQAEALPRWPHQSDFESMAAVDFMRRVITQHPNEIVLIAIGPLTNVALMCAIDPQAASMLKALVVMGGDFRADRSAPEWNFFCDPHAAAITYRAPIPLIRTVGLEVTERADMPREEIKFKFNAELLRPVLDYADIWFRDAPTLVFHDPLAAATAFDDEICDFRRGVVQIDLSPGREGISGLMANDAGRHEVAASADYRRFYARFFDVVGRYPVTRRT